MITIYTSKQRLLVTLLILSRMVLQAHALICITTKTRILSRSAIILNAKKTAKPPKKTKGTSSSSSGFGGAAIEPCPCGSGNGYMKCCGKLHSDELAYASATAEQVVRARYSAYAKREINFIIGSTHPLNKDFVNDIEHWKGQIDINCYDNFELTKCEILSEEYNNNNELATVAFVANMIQSDSRERTAFMETSTFERAGKHIRNGAWLYKSGVISDPPGRDNLTLDQIATPPLVDGTEQINDSPIV